MVDFLKNNAFVSLEDYKWNLNPRMIRIMSVDNTRVHYLSEKQAKRKNATVIDDAGALLNDLGVPMISREQYDKSVLGTNKNNS